MGCCGQGKQRQNSLRAIRHGWCSSGRIGSRFALGREVGDIHILDHWCSQVCCAKSHGWMHEGGASDTNRKDHASPFQRRGRASSSRKPMLEAFAAAHRASGMAEFEYT